LDKYSL